MVTLATWDGNLRWISSSTRDLRAMFCYFSHHIPQAERGLCKLRCSWRSFLQGNARAAGRYGELYNFQAWIWLGLILFISIIASLT